MHLAANMLLLFLSLLLVLLPGSLQSPMERSNAQQIPSLVKDPRQNIDLQELFRMKKSLGTHFYPRFRNHWAITSLPLEADKDTLADAVVALRAGIPTDLLRQVVAQTKSYLEKRVSDMDKRVYVEEKWRQYLYQHSNKYLNDEGKCARDLEEFMPRRRIYSNSSKKKEKKPAVDPFGVDFKGRTLFQLFEEKQKGRYREKESSQYEEDLDNHPTICELLKMQGLPLENALVTVVRAQDTDDEQKRLFRNELIRHLTPKMGGDQFREGVNQAWLRAQMRESRMRRYRAGRDHKDPKVSEQNRLQVNHTMEMRRLGHKNGWDSKIVLQMIKKGPSHPVQDDGRTSEAEHNGSTQDALGTARLLQPPQSLVESQHATESTSMLTSPPRTPVYNHNFYYGPPGFEPEGANTYNREEDTDFSGYYSDYCDSNQYDNNECLAGEIDLHHQTSPQLDPANWHLGVGSPLSGYHLAAQDHLNPFGYTSQGDYHGNFEDSYDDNALSHYFGDELWAAPSVPNHHTTAQPPSIHADSQWDLSAPWHF